MSPLVQTKKQIYLPGGSASVGGLTDTLGLSAAVNLVETLAAKSDTSIQNVSSSYSDTIPGQSETIGLGTLYPDTLAGKTDVSTQSVAASYAETQAAVTDISTQSVASSYAETQAGKTEATTIGTSGSGLSDSKAAITESRSSIVDAWAGGNTTSGTAPTNPTNAQGSVNTTVATVKAGGVANGTSQLTLTTFSPPTGGTPNLLRLYYQTLPTAVTDTCTVAYTPQGLAEVVLHTDAVARNFLTTSEDIDISALTQAQIAGMTVRFLHASTTPATGGSMTVDAVAISKVAVL